MTVRVQREAFDSGAEINDFTARNRGSGAIATFIGQMRDFRSPAREPVTAMTLDHYPGMCESEISAHVAAAYTRWPLLAVRIVHRVGRLTPGERIVFVGVASAHRQAAFAACEFLMDYLKTSAPFWKLEEREAGSNWVEARAEDDASVKRWQSP